MNDRSHEQLMEERRGLETYQLNRQMEDEQRANETAAIEKMFAPPKDMDEGESAEQSWGYWLTAKDVLVIAVLLIVAVFFFCIPWM